MESIPIYISFWCHADNADLKVMIEDLGSLSALPPVTAAVEQSSQSRRFQWLKPWRWISGLGWKGENERAIIELTAQVQGLGLENCTSVQVSIQSGRLHEAMLFRPCRQPFMALANMLLYSISDIGLKQLSRLLRKESCHEVGKHHQHWACPFEAPAFNYLTSSPLRTASWLCHEEQPPYV